MIRIICFPQDEKVAQVLDFAQVAALIQNPHNLVWVDFWGEGHERVEPILKETFGFHPLAVDDALDATQVPKLDDWGEYLMFRWMRKRGWM